MAAEHNPEIRPDLTASDMTIQSDSENYGNNELSPSPSSSSGSPLILYKNPTVWSIMRGAAINLFLPFVNGLMLGWGELFAHEIAFQFGWSTTRACDPLYQDNNRCFILTYNHRCSPVVGGQDLLDLV